MATRSGRLRALRAGLAWTTAIFAVLAIGVYAGWNGDQKVLRQVAFEESGDFPTTGERIVALNTWVYRNRGFAKNRHYYLFPGLGPTPIDVLRYGGDCADKSRLLSALLAEIGVRSTLVMLYPCENCEPVHTVVEARQDDTSIVLDPVYDLFFPDGKGGYLGVRDLAFDPDGFSARIHDQRQSRGHLDKINFYGYESIHFQNARTVNWKKNEATRVIGGWLADLGYDPFLVTRPRWLEDPKLFLCLALFVLMGSCATGVGLCELFVRLKHGPDRRDT